MSRERSDTGTDLAQEVAAELRAEFPELWAMSEQYDFAERLGGCADPLLGEVDAALRELWMARTNAKEASRV